MLASEDRGIRVGEELSHTTFATVYKARIGKYKMALKKIDLTLDIDTDNPAESLTTGTYNEIKTLRLLRGHPNTVQYIHHAFEPDGTVYILTEYMGGGTMLSRVKEGPLPYQHRMDYGRLVVKQILEALDFMHKKGIAHLDLKPENILLDRQGNAKIADFGFVEETEEGRVHFCTRGSQTFRAPEILVKRGFYPRLADIWSLGVTFYVLFTGYFPYPEAQIRTLIQRRFNGLHFAPEKIEDEEGLEMLENMLEICSGNRKTARELADCPFLARTPYLQLDKHIRPCCQYIPSLLHSGQNE